jgi:hypothetical protein
MEHVEEVLSTDAAQEAAKKAVAVAVEMVVGAVEMVVGAVERVNHSVEEAQVDHMVMLVV